MLKELAQTAFAGAAGLSITGALSPVVWGAAALRGPRAADPLLELWAKSMLASAGVVTEAVGLEHLPEGHCVFVCNHQSHYDAFLILKHVPKHIRYVAKRELARIPVFGHAVRATGNIVVDRTGSSKDRERLQDAVHAVRERVSVMFFPEGTRSEDGVLRPFKKGAAMLAIQSGVPVVPMAVSGTRLILPKGGRSVRWGQRAALVVGKPISPVGLQPSDRDAFTQRLQAAVSELYAQARERSGDLP
ncbi:1-acyl-sn-glycerol-3-phosphate acyltransferase [Aggregicoccus sp. 17bor-14]|nr:MULTISPECIES: lysophospholipid acyltransferase family protein [Myxococcaceae]MBF5044431.1 1-acyl-sn-glycerol-3-phosphate acyltransferase [Simulacricoccus sp. 17bor-14]MRI90177.1 1-acyl-sn-glycerol-3-phosphate acyltransferase [Aggregicoccus sp. 17bor-14]